ncbi:thioesterase II family protein [Vreelandella alkaliphila]|uniref:thioesterase II family protein n=1 Tax=Halomonadaceae TaxID=28256 RepID=UPI0018687202|nr:MULTISPECIES: alpha/beta fold hydrolase [Halomonas]
MHKQLRLVKPGTRRQLICFHFAGGNAEYFLPWKNHLDAQTAVYAVQLPGRGQRLAEGLKTCLHQCADEVVGSLAMLPQRPTFFFGHSMGATLAFETALRWEKRGQSLEHLFISGRMPPDQNSGTDYYRRSDQELIEKVSALGGTASDVFACQALRELVMPILRADFEAIETYQRRNFDTLSCPVSALLGRRDTEVRSDEICRWAEVTSGRFEFQGFQGGHFYLNEKSHHFFQYLKNKISEYDKCVY